MGDNLWFYEKISEYFSKAGHPHVRMRDLTREFTDDPGNEVVILVKLSLPYYDDGYFENEEDEDNFDYDSPLIPDQLTQAFVDELDRGDHAVSYDRIRVNATDLYLFIAQK